MLSTPVALIIFRRPDLTEQAIRAIAEVRPRTLLVIADGPRPNHPEDIEACAETLAVIDRIDWDCEVQINRADRNLGCGWRPATGISWVFEQVAEAIILEDDCIPHPSFFRFCEEMLTRYRDDERVMNIGGSNYENGSLPPPHAYVFSRLPGCVGSWATWRRAWKHFDQRLALWPLLRNGPLLKSVVVHDEIVDFYRKVFDEIHAAEGNVSYWDYQWTFACWANRGLAIVPRVNLVSNIGFGNGATHSSQANHPSLNLRAVEMPFPLDHPPFVLEDFAIDQQWLLKDLEFCKTLHTSFHKRALHKVRRMAGQLKHRLTDGLIAGKR